MTSTTTSGSTAVALLETVWKAATIRVPDTPQNITLTVNSKGGNVLGYYAPSRWKDSDTPVHEVAVTSTSIRLGARNVLTTVLHEAVHALAKARGVKDTSRQGRWHNQKFVELAGEYGLVYPYHYPDDDTVSPRKRGKMLPDDRIGYSAVTLPDTNLVLYQGVLDTLIKEFPFDIAYGERLKEKPRQVLHTYIVVPRDDLHGEYYDVIQMAPSRYKRIEPYLTAHEALESTHRQDFIVDSLVSRGYPIHLSTEDYAR